MRGLRALVAAELEPVLPVVLEAVGQGLEGRVDPGTAYDAGAPWPTPEHAEQCRWRAGAVALAAAFPALWQALAGRLPEAGQHPDASARVDLVVDVDALGRLVAADLASVPVADLAAALGLADVAAAARQLPGLTAEVAVPALADVLAQLFHAGRGAAS